MIAAACRFDERFPDWSHDAFDTDKYYTKWFAGGTEVDTEIRETFGADIEAVRSGERDSWRGEPMTCLAGIVLMDQLTRNAFRGTAKMCAAPTCALTLGAHRHALTPQAPWLPVLCDTRAERHAEAEQSMESFEFGAVAHRAGRVRSVPST